MRLMRTRTRDTQEQVFFSPAETAKRAGIGRSSVYALNQKYRFIRKLGSRSLIKWDDFENALLKETRK